MKRFALLFTAIMIGCLFLQAKQIFAADILDSLGVNRCNASGVVFGVDTSCEDACSSAQIDLSTLRNLVPSNYQDQLQNLCSSNASRCCAQRGDALCKKAAERVGLIGSCKSSCGSNEVDVAVLIKGLPAGTNPCMSGGSCCVPQGSAVEVKPLKKDSVSFSGLRQGISVVSGAAAATTETKMTSVPTPGYGLINPLGSRSVPTLVADFIKWLSGLAGAAFTIYLFWGGIEWMTAMGNPKKTAAAQERIVHAIMGIAIIFLAYFIIEALIGFTNIAF